MKLALLASGGGTTLREILFAVSTGYLIGVEPVLVISSKPDAGCIEKARAACIVNIQVISDRGKSADQFADEMLAACDAAEVDWIGQFGWMPLTPAKVIAAYQGRMLNQHPGPLDPGRPDFGGKGMYGTRVHCARLEFVRRTAPEGLEPGTDEFAQHWWTEVTAHHVTPEFDKGDIIATIRVPIEPQDTAATLQARALVFEHKLQIDTLRAISEGRTPSWKRTGPLVLPEHYGILEEAKRFAIAEFPHG